MSHESKLPDFDEFSRWLASRLSQQSLSAEHFARLRAAARDARDEFVLAQRPASPGSFEVLQLLAAADHDAALPPEITTPRGFRVSLAYDEGNGEEGASIGVLVTSPPDMIADVWGKTVYLWSGNQRFELGQFDAEGKALGTLPGGIDITASDLASGHVKLETPENT
jgi:hypothetical protein